MPRYTNTQTITFSDKQEYVAVVVNRHTLGTVEVEVFDGVSWVSCGTYVKSGKYKLFVKARQLRFTPAGGAAYYVARGL